MNSAVTYLIQCDTCAGNIPLAMKWWILKKRRYGTGGDAAKPVYDSGEVHYEHVSKVLRMNIIQIMLLLKEMMQNAHTVES